MIRRTRPLIILAFVIVSMAQCRAFATERVRRNVEVEWETIEGASEYEVQVIRKDKGEHKPLLFKSKGAHWTATINPGNYTMQIRAIDDRGAPGEWSPASELNVKLPSVILETPKAQDAIKASNEEIDTVAFTWDEVPGAKQYKINARATKKDWKIEQIVDGASVKLQVPVGQEIEWNVVALDDKGQLGDVNDTMTPFQHVGPKLNRPNINKPLSKYLKQLSWEEPKYAHHFGYELWYKNPKTKNWEKLEAKSDFSSHDLKLDISRPSGRYRLKVQAFGDLRQPSTVSQMEFSMRGGFKDPNALEAAIMRDSITKPTKFYAIASYMITRVDYQNTILESRQQVNFAALGGTGRIGIGYQDAESPWGGFAIADESGFTIGSQTYNFSSFELHAIRKLEFGQRNLLQAAGGVFMKELPLLQGDAVSGFTGVGKIRSIGPHIGVTYWFPLSERLGLQTNARAYYTMMGSTNYGGKSYTTLSYQGGALGTYRLSPAWMGYLGYAYRTDSAVYDANANSSNFANPGDKDTLQINGHYLNLLLEFSF